MSTEADFVEEYRGLVTSIATKVRAQFSLDVDLDDLLADGFKGLVEAKSRFDPSKGVQFNTFAYYRIRGSIIDGVRKNAFLSRRAYQKLKAAEAALEEGESAGDTRAANPKTAAAAAEAIHGTLARLSASFVLASIGQKDDSESETPEDSLLKEEAKSRLRDANEKLPDREKALVAGHYLQGRRFDKVAEELGISKSWASRLHTKALGRLRELLTESE
ncbi:MAG: sigma-70 family RNA polymerase sigma factor [Myxococcota bacterium]